MSIELSTRELNYIWLFFLVLVITIRVTVSTKESIVLTLFFAAIAFAVTWVSTGGNTLGREQRRAQNMAGTVVDIYEKELRAKIPDIIWEEHVCIERPDTLRYSTMDASILRALQKVYELYSQYDIDAVGKIFAFTEAYYALYVVELASDNDKKERIDDLMDIRRTLLNLVHTLVVSRGPPTYNDKNWEKIEQVFTARTYKCMNNLSNKKNIAYKNPHSFSDAVFAPRHSFHMVV